MEKLHLEIITPERVMVSEDVDMLEARGALGEFGVLPGHATYLTSIVPCEVRIFSEDKTTFLSSASGFAEVKDNEVTLLLDAAEFAEEIDVSRAEHARDRAESALKDISFDADDYRRYELALLRAISRIQTASRGR